MLPMNVSEPAQLDRDSHIVFAQKKDWPLQICVNYRELKAVSGKRAYPITQMREWIDLIGEARIL